MASGSYIPPAVRRVDIPKATGGTRPLSNGGHSGRGRYANPGARLRYVLAV